VSWLRRLLGTEPPLLRRASGDLCDIHIVGESFYPEAIERVWQHYGRAQFEIVLRADTDNRYDASCVAVLVDELRVGNLCRDQAGEWQPTALAAAAEGYVLAGPAQLFGGTKDKPNFGVFGSVVWPGPAEPPACDHS
jgi:hypothetical protein